MRVGILCLQNVPFREVRERARRAEAMGVDAFLAADHFVNPYHPGEPWLDAWTLLGALAASTERIGLGTLVSPITLRNPAILARSVATLDEVSDGRAECSLGAGGAPLDHSMTGIPAWPRPERNERFAAAAAIVRALLDSGRVMESGALAGPYPTSGTIVEPHGHDGRRIRLTIAALGPRAITVAAEFGDAWNSYGVGSGRDVHGLLPWDAAMTLLRGRAAALEAACAEVGRAPGAVTRSYTLVETYQGYPERDRMLAMLEDLRTAEIDEVVGYWPEDSADERRMEEFVGLARGG
jgi:alkanesulfonate monooxygenase SsuD/methylene tetrahydromethanopterin reductase-like flavin-dependent oxidoreductase (luciferase family)